MNYDFNYENEQRFVSYYHQIRNIISLRPKTVLEIGVGSGVVKSYLIKHGIKVTTFDKDKGTKPDVVGDIKNMKFPNNSFDVVSCCEVLEHLPYYVFDKIALDEIARVSKRYVIISLPYPSIHIGAIIQNNIMSINIPEIWKNIKWKQDGDHHWEIGLNGFPLDLIRKSLRNHFDLINEYRSKHNPYHYFFILQKKLIEDDR